MSIGWRECRQTGPGSRPNRLTMVRGHSRSSQRLKIAAGPRTVPVSADCVLARTKSVPQSATILPSLATLPPIGACLVVLVLVVLVLFLLFPRGLLFPPKGTSTCWLSSSRLRRRFKERRLTDNRACRKWSRADRLVSVRTALSCLSLTRSTMIDDGGIHE